MWEIRESLLKGRGLFATRHIKAGEVVLAEEPVLLIVSHEYRNAACVNCLRLSPGGQVCPVCRQAVFCGPACQQVATSMPHIHSPELCRALSRIDSFPVSTEEKSQARFLFHILALRGMQDQDPAQRYAKFLQLVGSASADHLATATKLHGCIIDATGVPVSIEELATLLCKEQLNSYGIMAAAGPEQRRSIRGSGVYFNSSLINHECVPTVARFDDFDRAGPSNTTISFRAIHDIPAGEEVIQSYIPLGWDLQERQQHLQQVYSFCCNCPRCQTEASSDWSLAGCSDGEWQTDSGSGEEEEEFMVEGTPEPADADKQQGAASSLSFTPDPCKALDPTYLQLFLLKYMCPNPHCGGTLAPLLGKGTLECNVCGNTRTEQEFMAELEVQ